MEDFAAEAKFTTDFLGKNAGETGRRLIRNAILLTKFPAVNGNIIFRDHLWGIIATLFKQKPVYQQGNLYVSTYTTGGPKKDIIDNTVYTEFAPGALEDSEELDLDLEEEGTRPYSGSLTRSRSRSIIDLVSRSPQSIIDLVSKSPNARKKKSPNPKKKKSPSPKKKKKKTSPSPKKKKSNRSKSKKKSCSPGKVRDTRTKRCRERRKPGPQPKSGCPKGKVRDKYSKRCRSSRR
jgi:hypothetical protein